MMTLGYPLRYSHYKDNISLNKVPRCILLLQNATKSENTYKNYFYNLNRFRKHFKIKDFDSLLEIDSKKINEMLEDWLMFLRNKVSPNSIPSMYYGLELFFAMNDVTINFKKLRRMLPGKVKRSGANPWKTEDIQKMLSVCRYKRDKAIVLFLSSTGSRVGCIDGLKIKHIIEMQLGCKAVWVYADDKEEYWAFLTPESSKALDEYFKERIEDNEKLTDDSPVFRTLYSKENFQNPKPLAFQSARCVVFRLIKQARIQRKKVGFTYDIQADHGFRKRFNTILKLNNEVNSNIAEKLMGHKRGLDGTYFAPTREECFEEFKKSTNELMIAESWRLKIELEKKNDQLDKQQSDKDNRILELESRLVNTEKLLLEIKNRL